MKILTQLNIIILLLALGCSDREAINPEMKPLTIQSFSVITHRVIEECGFDEFQSTLCIPEIKKILTLDGIPNEQFNDTRNISIEWATNKVEGNAEFFLSYKSDKDHFIVIHRLNGRLEEQSFKIKGSEPVN